MIICCCRHFNDQAVQRAVITLQESGKTPTPGQVFKVCSGGQKAQCSRCVPDLSALIDAQIGVQTPLSP